MSPTVKLRQAAAMPEADDREWLALKARLDQIEQWIALGVPRAAAFQASERLERARRLPAKRRIRACVVVARWMLQQRGRVRGVVLA